MTVVSLRRRSSGRHRGPPRDPSPRSSPRPKTPSPPRTCFGMERPPAAGGRYREQAPVPESGVEKGLPRAAQPDGREQCDPEDDAELICRPKSSGEAAAWRPKIN